MFSFKPDFAKTRERIEAFWERDVLDRPLTMFTLEKPAGEQVPMPASNHASPAERWMDVQYTTEYALARLSNLDFSLGDSLPMTFPNLGPEVFSAFYGCPLHFGDYGTSWTDLTGMSESRGLVEDSAGRLWSLPEDFSRDNAPGLFHKLQNRIGGDALSAAAFTNNAHHFAGRDVEGDSVQSFGNAYIGVEVGLQIINPQDSFFFCYCF